MLIKVLMSLDGGLSLQWENKFYLVEVVPSPGGTYGVVTWRKSSLVSLDAETGMEQAEAIQKFREMVMRRRRLAVVLDGAFRGKQVCILGLAGPPQVDSDRQLEVVLGGPFWGKQVCVLGLADQPQVLVEQVDSDRQLEVPAGDLFFLTD